MGLQLTLDSGYEFAEKTVMIKPKQSAFKAAAKETNITLCKNEDGAYTLEFQVKIPKAAEISYVKPVALPEGFLYDRKKQTLQIVDAGKLRSKKIYNITFEVTPKGAYRSVKPAKVTVKVKVMN